MGIDFDEHDEPIRGLPTLSHRRCLHLDHVAEHRNGSSVEPGPSSYPERSPWPEPSSSAKPSADSASTPIER
jgi:hypothetical protein